MTDFRNPTWLVERAWSSHTLAALQRVIELTISQLERIERAPTESDGGFALDARTEALKACCAELRHASAITDAEAHRAAHCELVRRHIAEQREWGEAFAQALLEYRRAASVALQASLAAPAPTGTRAS